MKKNKIIVFALVLTLTFTFSGCAKKDPNVGYNNRNLSTQTRDNRWDKNLTGTDTVRDNNRNNIGMYDNIDGRDNTNMSNSLDNDYDMGMNNGMRDGLDTNLNNGMTRPNNNSNTNTNTMMGMNKNASKIAEKITNLSEVTKASVLLSEKNAVVGVNLRGNTQNTMTNSLRQKIEDIVKKEDKSIDNISVTTDPSLVSRIDTMYTSVDGGNMIDNFADEVRDLIRRITPNNMR